MLLFFFLVFGCVWHVFLTFLHRTTTIQKLKLKHPDCEKRTLSLCWSGGKCQNTHPRQSKKSEPPSETICHTKLAQTPSKYKYMTMNAFIVFNEGTRESSTLTANHLREGHLQGFLIIRRKSLAHEPHLTFHLLHLRALCLDLNAKLLVALGSRLRRWP